MQSAGSAQQGRERERTGNEVDHEGKERGKTHAERSQGAQGRMLQDHFTVGGELGSGGFSTVRAGKRLEDGKEVAIKTLPKRGRTGDLDLVRNEIKIMSLIFEHIQHPNIVKLIDLFNEPNTVHIIEELCTGGELFYRIEQKVKKGKGAFSEKDAAEIIRQVASALQALHGLNILHRDLKPENILYETRAPESKIKIMDFGLSYQEGTKDPMPRLLGSADYIAPEVLLERKFSKAADMWSLGVILYILLSGFPPFSGYNTDSKLENIINGRFHFNHSVWVQISPEAKDLISNLLVVDPAKRYNTVHVLGHPWIYKPGVAREVPMKATIEHMSMFNARRKFRVAALACIAGASVKRIASHLKDTIGSTSFTVDELQQLKSDFKAVAGPGTSIDFAQFQRVMMGRMSDSTSMLRRVFELFDENRDGHIDFREFVTGLSSIRSSAGEERVQMCFKIYDVDDSGWISREELYDMLSAVSPATEDGAESIIQTELLSNLFERLDVNHDGRLSYDEFRVGINHDPFLIDIFFGNVTQ